MSEKQEEKKLDPVKADKFAEAKAELEEMKQWADSTKDEEKAKSEGKKETDKAVKEAAPKKDTVKEKELKEKPIAAQKQQEAKKQPEAKKAAPKTTSQPAKKTDGKGKSKQAQKGKPTIRTKGSPGKKKHNYLLWVTIIVIAIPCILLLYILLGSRESSTSPVEGSRFKRNLDPEITEQDLTALKDILQFDDAQAVEINLKSATLRINIDTRDDMSQDEVKELLVAAYDKVVEKLPVDTYFKNKGSDDSIVKMYDLQVSAYNYIPETEEDKAGQIHLSRTKNAAADEVIDDVLSSPKDEKSADEILNPDTSNPPTSTEESGNGEGE